MSRATPSEQTQRSTEINAESDAALEAVTLASVRVFQERWKDAAFELEKALHHVRSLMDMGQ